jgi:hypothetical protein
MSSVRIIPIVLTSSMLTPSYQSIIRDNSNLLVRKIEKIFFCVFFFLQLKIYVLGSDIVLHRKHQPTVSWPLTKLRRYGHDGNFFLFETGRRYALGEGVFSFKCERSDILFEAIQAQINSLTNNGETITSEFSGLDRNVAHLNNLNMGVLHQGIQGSSYVFNNRPSSALSPAGSNSFQSRSSDTLMTDYLEPNPSRIHTLQTTMRLSSVGSGGPLSPSSPGSQNSYTNILEITNLNPAPQTSNKNIYQEYPSATMQKPTKLSLDVAPQEQAPIATPVNDPSMNVYMNAEVGKRATLAQMESLEVEPEVSSPDSTKAQAATYMNVVVGEEKSKAVSTPPVTMPACVEATKENIQPPVVTTPPVLTNNLNSRQNDIKKDYTKANIFGFSRALSFSQDATRCYENMDIGPSEMKPLMLRNRYSRPEIFSKVDLPLIDRTDKSEPCTPTQRKVNYIVLDLGQPNQTTTINYNNLNSNNNNSNDGSEISCSDNAMVNSVSMQSGLLPPESPKKLGYATIDFDRSTALSNILSNTPIVDFDQSSRKTRHDSNVTPVLMTMKHSNSISD